MAMIGTSIVDQSNVVSGVSQLADTLKKMFTLPTLGMPVGILGQAVGAVFDKFAGLIGIPICATKQTLIGKNKLGEQVIINTGEKGASAVTDNIVPMGREWKVEGYLSFDFIPTPPMIIGNSPMAASVKNLAERAILMQLATSYIEYLRTMRAPFYFHTLEGEKVEAVISDYSIIAVPEFENAKQITLDIKQYIVLQTGTSIDKLNVPLQGFKFNIASVVSGTVATAVTSGVGKLIGAM